MRVTRYHPDRRAEWDAFVRRSRNGVFLFERGYMDYHANRFIDHSLLLVDRRNRLLAVLPANEFGKSFESHGGLTFGGFVIGEEMTSERMLESFGATIEYLSSRAFTEWKYKSVPHIYHSLPAEEDLYALFRNGARITRVDISSALCPRLHAPIQKRRSRGRRTAENEGVTVSASDDFPQFWDILTASLALHGISPTHSLEEITLLKSRFPAQICLRVCALNDQILAGAVIYVHKTVAHAQYIASTRLGREIGALDLLFLTLIENEYFDSPYFDFGISTEANGTILNTGLVAQKEGFGARGITHNHFALPISALPHLDVELPED